METSRLRVSSCQRCRYFAFEGRRGGHCEQLNVPVQGRWASCSLADPLFSGSIDTIAQASLSNWSEIVLRHHDDAIFETQPPRLSESAPA